MAKRNLPAVRNRQDLARKDPKYDSSLATLYPTQPILPRPSKLPFVNRIRENRVRSFDGVVKASNEFLHSLSEHQRAIGRLDNIGREVHYDREVVEYNIDRIAQRRKQLRGKKKSKKGGKPKGLTAIGQVMDDE